MQEGDDKPVPLDPPAEIYIKDINVGGVFFVCTDARRHFANGDKLLMIINLSGSRLELNAEVLREQTIDSQKNRYRLRMPFYRCFSFAGRNYFKIYLQAAV